MVQAPAATFTLACGIPRASTTIPYGVPTTMMQLAAGFGYQLDAYNGRSRAQRIYQDVLVYETGVVQVVSALPRSYPGHSLLTEDLGDLLGEDDCRCGQLGRTFRVLGRVPKAELRGCSARG